MMLNINIKRIQILFFGLPRGVAYTQESIKNILDDRYEIRRDACFVDKNLFSNPRSLEQNEKIDFSIVKECLQLDSMNLISPNAIKNLSYERFKTQYGNAFDDDGTSYNNLIEQLSTLEKLKDKIKKNYDLFIFLRPDLFYLDKISLDNINNKSIYLPNWQSFGGENDRFAFTRSYHAAKLYATRITQIPNYCRIKGKAVHSESLLNFALTQGRINVKNINNRAIRVRNNGSHVIENFKWTSYRTRIKNFLGIN